MSNKFKSFLADDGVFYTLLIVLIAIVSFGLGRQSALSNSEITASTNNMAKIQVIQPNKAYFDRVNSLDSDTGAAVVASKSGTKYHLPDCPGARTIKPENIVQFASVAAAESAGYTPAANCEF